jgi:hypothetical protein
MRRVLSDNQPTVFALNFSRTPQFLFIWMSEASVVVALVNVCAAGRLATVIGLTSRHGVIVLSSAFFPWLPACESRTLGQVLLSTSRPGRSSSPGIPNLFVHDVFRIVNYFHQFHLRTILN